MFMSFLSPSPSLQGASSGVMHVGLGGGGGNGKKEEKKREEGGGGDDRLTGGKGGMGGVAE